jgi:hypothetical protein
MIHSAHIVKWVTESNRPISIVNDRELQELLNAGRPYLTVPSSSTVSCDIDAAFKRCRERIKKILQEHEGRLHFATDCWTSPNHHAFVAWTVHLEYRGTMLSFLLDLIELPTVCVSTNHSSFVTKVQVSPTQELRWRKHFRGC